MIIAASAVPQSGPLSHGALEATDGSDSANSLCVVVDHYIISFSIAEKPDGLIVNGTVTGTITPAQRGGELSVTDGKDGATISGKVYWDQTGLSLDATEGPDLTLSGVDGVNSGWSAAIY